MQNTAKVLYTPERRKAFAKVKWENDRQPESDEVDAFMERGYEIHTDEEAGDFYGGATLEFLTIEGNGRTDTQKRIDIEECFGVVIVAK